MELRLRRTGIRGFLDREFQPGNVLGGLARRLAHLLAHNVRPIGEFPRRAEEMTSDRFSLFQQGRDWLAEGPIQHSRRIFCTHVNLRSGRLQLRDRDAAVDGDCRREFSSPSARAAVASDPVRAKTKTSLFMCDSVRRPDPAAKPVLARQAQTCPIPNLNKPDHCGAPPPSLVSVCRSGPRSVPIGKGPNSRPQAAGARSPAPGFPPRLRKC